jgi:hypothetical protein
MCNPWTDLRFSKIDEIQIIAFLPVLEKIIVDLRQLFRNLSCADVMAIEKATYPCVFGRGKPLPDQKG